MTENQEAEFMNETTEGETQETSDNNDRWRELRLKNMTSIAGKKEKKCYYFVK
jgi:hypothetical protein